MIAPPTPTQTPIIVFLLLSLRPELPAEFPLESRLAATVEVANGVLVEGTTALVVRTWAIVLPALTVRIVVTTCWVRLTTTGERVVLMTDALVVGCSEDGPGVEEAGLAEAEEDVSAGGGEEEGGEGDGVDAVEAGEGGEDG